MRCPKCGKPLFFFEARKEFECRHCKASLRFPELSFYLVFMLFGSLMFFAVYAISGFESSPLLWIGGPVSYLLAGFIAGRLFAHKLKDATEVHQRG